MKKIIVFIVFSLLTSTAHADFFGGNNGFFGNNNSGEWKMGPNVASFSVKNLTSPI